MTPPTAALRLYRFALSGHCHRVELFLSLLGLPFEKIEVDLTKGAHKLPAFLAKNPFGQVPVLEDGDLTLSDSNAILVYLALRYDPTQRWLPRDPAQAGQVQRWLSVAAGELVLGPAAARMVKLFGAKLNLERAQATAQQLFGVLEQQLAGRAFVLGSEPTIADLALFTYASHAPEGGVALAPYPALRAFLGRIEALPRFVPMQRSGDVQ